MNNERKILEVLAIINEEVINLNKDSERMSKSITGLVKSATKRAAESGLLLGLSRKQQEQLNDFSVQLEDIKARLEKIEGNSTQILENQRKQIGFK